jgi:hypothetical protein
LSLDIRSLRQRTGGPERQLASYRVILCCVEVEYAIDDQRRVSVLGARTALPEEAWAAQQDAAAALNAASLDDDDALADDTTTADLHASDDEAEAARMQRC